MSSAASAIDSPRQGTPAWNASIPSWNRSVVLLAITVAAYFQTWVDLWPFWENKNATYTHGTVIAAVTLWLVWRTRPALRGIAPKAEPLALLPMLLLSAAWMLATRANLFIVHAVLWPLLAFAILWAGVGRRAALTMAFPLSFLYFAIPVWDYLKPPLQAITSFMVGTLTGLAGVPAAVDGPFITLPNDTIYIALDCSGAHFLCVALAVGVLAGVMRNDNLPTRLLILAIAAGLSMLFNWTRILLIVFAYLHTDLKEWMETMGHLTFGWWVFALDLLVFGLVLRLVPSSGESEAHSAGVPAPAKPTRTDRTGLALTVVAALLLPISTWAALRTQDPRAAHFAAGAPEFATSAAPADGRWMPSFTGAAWEYRTALFASEGRTIEVYGNEYREQTHGRELVSHGSPLFPPTSFTTQSSATIELGRESSAPLPATRVELIDRSNQRWVGLYTYYVDDVVAPSPRRIQLISAIRALYSRPIAGVVAVAMPCVPDCDATSAILGEALISTYAAHRESGMPERR